MVVDYRNLERLVGCEKISVRKGEFEMEGFQRIYDTLGCPATPEGYEWPEK